MLTWLYAGSWIMLPIILCSIIALVIISERFWHLRDNLIIPNHLFSQVKNLVIKGTITKNHLTYLQKHSPLGRIFAIGLYYRHLSREVLQNHLEQVGRHEAYQLERFLDFLGTIAAITPLLGLLGTVLGMIEVFDTITGQTVVNTKALSGGIAKALITTASGLIVAIPSLFFYRYFKHKVEALTIALEQESLKLLNYLKK